MIEKTIDHIVYQLKQNKEEGHGAVVFIGAGCSVSAGIPTADKIVEYVMDIHKDHPDIKSLEEKPSYAELMECLGPQERNKIFKHYVEKAKINVSHIYLAHLMAMGYVDYIVTVNFDNIAQRALALYNIFPPIYDISTFKDLNTRSLDIKSITYLHGQHNGMWQLNTKDEMKKVIDSDAAKTIFNQISINRLWLVVGYSGDDLIFDLFIKLGRVNNGLYWVGYKDNKPSSKAQASLLDQPNTESFWVKGYDADSFFLKLNSKLGGGEPPIFTKPFTFLSELQNNINDIDNTEDYKSFKERLIESKKMVLDAINNYERSETNGPQMTSRDIERTHLINALIDSMIYEQYDEFLKLEAQVIDKTDNELMSIVANTYNMWATGLGRIGKTKSNKKEAEKLYTQAFEKFEKATTIEKENNEFYFNWACVLGDYAEIVPISDAADIYLEAFDKYKKSIELNPNHFDCYFQWGINLAQFAQTKVGSEREKYYYDAFEKYTKALEIDNGSFDVYNVWGIDLTDMAKTCKDSEKIYLQVFEKYKKSLSIEPDQYDTYSFWGIALFRYAKTKTGKEEELLYHQAFNKYRKALDINPEYYEAYGLWASNLCEIALSKSDLERDKIYLKAFEKFNKAVNINSNVPEIFFNWGNGLIAFAKTKLGVEANGFYEEGFQKYIKAIELRPDYYNAYDNLGIELKNFAKIVDSSEESDRLYRLAFETLNKVNELDNRSYNLACLYAVTNNDITTNDDIVFDLLEKSLKNGEINFEFVEKDRDWENYRHDLRYKRLMDEYQL